MKIIDVWEHSIIHYSYILLFLILFFYGLYHGKSFFASQASGFSSQVGQRQSQLTKMLEQLKDFFHSQLA